MITEILEKHFETYDQSIAEKYYEDYRYYHNVNHIVNMLNFSHVNYKDKLDEHLYNLLEIAIIFHDVVYKVGAKDNEALSYFECESFCLKHNKFIEDLPILKDMIMATKDHIFTENMPIHIEAIVKSDLNQFAAPIEIVWENTMKLFKEFQCYDWLDFQKGQIDFLNYIKPRIELGFRGTDAIKNIDLTIEMIKCWKPNIAIFPGSFNPFHEGHLNILEKAEETFDKVIIAKGYNPEKEANETSLPTIVSNRQIINYVGLLTECLNNIKYPVTVIRGIRNTTDLIYEMNQYRFLKDLKQEIKVISFFCDPEYAHISSSAIRSLKKYGINKYNL